MRKPVEIPPLTAEEVEALDKLYRTSKDVRLRTRAQIVLLAGEQPMTAPAIAKIVRQTDQTVRNWLNGSLAQGIEGLKDPPMPGSPSKITKEYEQQFRAVVRLGPGSLGQPSSTWTLERLADSMAEQRGIRVSYETVPRVLAEAEMVLWPPQQKIRSPDREYLLKKRRLKRSAMA